MNCSVSSLFLLEQDTIALRYDLHGIVLGVQLLKWLQALCQPPLRQGHAWISLVWRSDLAKGKWWYLGYLTFSEGLARILWAFSLSCFLVSWFIWWKNLAERRKIHIFKERKEMAVGVPKYSLCNIFIHWSTLWALDSRVCQFKKSTVKGTVYTT